MTLLILEKPNGLKLKPANRVNVVDLVKVISPLIVRVRVVWCSGLSRSAGCGN